MPGLALFRDNTPVHTAASVQELKWQQRWQEELLASQFAEYCNFGPFSLPESGVEACYPLAAPGQLQGEPVLSELSPEAGSLSPFGRDYRLKNNPNYLKFNNDSY
jgi:hypothetical protein